MEMNKNETVIPQDAELKDEALDAAQGGILRHDELPKPPKPKRL